MACRYHAKGCNASECAGIVAFVIVWIKVLRTVALTAIDQFPCLKTPCSGNRCTLVAPAIGCGAHIAPAALRAIDSANAPRISLI
jgi:hypothetical protein